MKGINDHNLGLSVLQVSKASQKIGNDTVARNHGIGKDGIAIVLAADFERIHGLLFEVRESEFLALDVELFLVECLVVRHVDTGCRPSTNDGRCKGSGRLESGEGHESNGSSKHGDDDGYRMRRVSCKLGRLGKRERDEK